MNVLFPFSRYRAGIKMETSGSSIRLQLSNKVQVAINQETVILATNLYFAIEKMSNNT